jgi:hypothetical protein
MKRNHSRAAGTEDRMAARLKVYQASFGFRDSVVAAPNQKLALEAWGARQNLFAEGLAHASDDPKAAKAALAHPGVPLSRAIGSTGPFGVDSADLPTIPIAPRRKTKDTTSAPSKAKPAEAPKAVPDRGALDAAEAALHEIQTRRRAVEDDFHARLEKLEEARAAALRKADAEVALARKKVESARRRYRDAGGSD